MLISLGGGLRTLGDRRNCHTTLTILTRGTVRHAWCSHARLGVTRARLALTRQRLLVAHDPRSEHQRNRHEVLSHAAHAGNIFGGNPHRLPPLVRRFRSEP
jgi:hypothetical protein